MAVRAYYAVKDTGVFGYSLDGINFQETPGTSPIFAGTATVLSIDPNNGNNVVFAGSNGAGTTEIRTSSDNGITLNTPIGNWTTLDANIALQNSSDIQHVTSDVILIWGTGAIYKSVDSGQSFDILLDIASFYTSGTASAVDVYFTSVLSGAMLITDSNNSVSASLYVTTDGGNTWTILPGSTASFTSGKKVKKVFYNGSVIITVSNKDICRSTDNGQTFSVVHTFTTPYIGSVQLSINYAGGYLFVPDNIDGVLLTSLDLGLTWISNTNSNVGKIKAPYFYNEQSFPYPVGYFIQSTTVSSEIYKSDDAGQTSSLIVSVDNATTIKAVSYGCGDCPPGFTYDEITNNCTGTALGEPLCAEGFIYDPVENHCICEGNCDCPIIDLVFAVDVGPSVTVSELNGLKDFFTNPTSGFFNQAAITDLYNQNKLRVGFVTFSSAIGAIATLTNNKASSESFVNTFLSTIAGGTNTALGLAEARNLLFEPTTYSPDSVKKMVILTDGWPNSFEFYTNSFPYPSLINITDGAVQEYTLAAPSVYQASVLNTGDPANSTPPLAIMTLNTTVGLQAGMTIVAKAGSPDTARFNTQSNRRGVIYEVIDGTTISVAARPYLSGSPATYQVPFTIFSSSNVTSDVGNIYEVKVPVRSYLEENDYTAPCGRIPSGVFTDCDRCLSFKTTMEIAHDIKTIDNISITAAFLSSLPPGGINYTFQNIGLTPGQNPGNAFGVESYLTHRALIQGLVDQMTQIFPLSQASLSPYYVPTPTGYEPPNPIIGGNLGNLGLTGVPGGIPYGRLLWGDAVSSNFKSDFTSDAPAGDWGTIPAIYNQIALNPIGTFVPFSIWDCDPADINPAWIPMTSLRADGTPDFYIETFDNASIVMAPAIANNLCTAIQLIDCGSCTPVPDGDNVRCECEQTFQRSTCVTNVYACGDLTTPVYCSISPDLTPGQISRIQVDGIDIDDCFIFESTNQDYCDPLDFVDIVVLESFLDCSECGGTIYEISRCDNPAIMLYTDDPKFSAAAALSKSVQLVEFPALCWNVNLVQIYPVPTLTTLTISGEYDDCSCCNDYLP